MATLDDKLLGEKLQYYVSSSEDEGGSEADDSGSEDEACAPRTAPDKLVPAPINSWSGTASNTGPKGVIEDWRRYKQLEAEQREELEKERIELAKKLTLSCRTDQEDQQAAQTQELEDELNELIEDEFLLRYQKQRMQELMSQLQKTPTFGQLLSLTCKDDFLNAVDKEASAVTVIVHLYNEKAAACEAMNGCLAVLATEYPSIKFCQISVQVAGMSKLFRVEGVPALLVYKAGQVIGNFVKLASELGDDFYATDVERLLIEYGILPEK